MNKRLGVSMGWTKYGGVEKASKTQHPANHWKKYCFDFLTSFLKVISVIFYKHLIIKLLKKYQIKIFDVIIWKSQSIFIVTFLSMPDS